jgi:hypothetical protein
MPFNMDCTEQLWLNQCSSKKFQEVSCVLSSSALSKGGLGVPKWVVCSTLLNSVAFTKELSKFSVLYTHGLWDLGQPTISYASMVMVLVV